MRQRSGMRDYQVRAADRLYKGLPVRDAWGNFIYSLTTRTGIAVHIDMGLGKTIIGLTAIVDWFAFDVIRKPVLIIAPIKVCEGVWRQEAMQWAHTRHLTFSLVRGDEKKRSFALSRPAHVYLINPEALQWLQKYLREDWSFFDAVLIDESSMFKDHRAKRFRVLSNYGTQKALRDTEGKVVRDQDGKEVKVPPHRFKRFGVLTGTPSPSSLRNLWAPIYLCDHGTRLHRKFETFLGRFFHKVRQVAEHVFEYDVNAQEDEARPEYEARSGAPERIHELIADITVELNAEDYGILPRTIGDASKASFLNPLPPSHLHYVDLPPEVRKQYDVLEKEAIIELMSDTVMAQNGGAKSMMCWQIANGAIYKTDDYGRKTTVELHDEKLDKLVELIETINSNVIVPYYFVSDFQRIKARLHKEHIPFMSFREGKTEATIDAWNKGSVPVLLLHPQSASHGLNLQFGGHTLIWYTMLWSLEKYLQTNARLARSGQENIVGIHSIVARHTTDDLMLSSLAENGDDQTRFRKALRHYQQVRGIGLFDDPFKGLTI